MGELRFFFLPDNIRQAIQISGEKQLSLEVSLGFPFLPFLVSGMVGEFFSPALELQFLPKANSIINIEDSKASTRAG